VLSQAAIPPGGEGEIEVSFDTGHRRGAQKKTVTVTTNDPIDSTFGLSISGKIEVVFEFERSHLSFGRIYEGEETTKSAFIEVKDKAQTKIVAVETSTPEIEAKYVPKPDESFDNLYEIAVTLIPAATTSRLNGTVTVRSDLSSKPQATLHISAYVVTGVEITPRALVFSYAAGEDSDVGGFRKASILNHDKAKTLTVVSAVDPDGILSVAIAPVVEGEEFELTARVLKDKLPAVRKYSGQILIDTKYPEDEQLRLPYTLFQRDRPGE
jgi:hypothetical protein